MVHASIYSRGALTTEGGSYGVAPVLNEPQSEGFDLSEDLLYNRETDEMPEAVRSVMIYFSPEDQEAIAHGGYGIAMEKCMGLLDGTTDIMDLVEKHGVSQQLAQEAERLLPGFLGEDYPLKSFSMEGSRINLKYTEESMTVAGIAIIAAVISAVIALLAKIFGGKGSSSGGGGGGSKPAVEKAQTTTQSTINTLERVGVVEIPANVGTGNPPPEVSELVEHRKATKRLACMIPGTPEYKKFIEVLNMSVPTMTTRLEDTSVQSLSSSKQLAEMSKALMLFKEFDFSNPDFVKLAQIVKAFFKPMLVINVSGVTSVVDELKSFVSQSSKDITQKIDENNTIFSDKYTELVSGIDEKIQVNSTKIDPSEVIYGLQKIFDDLGISKDAEENIGDSFSKIEEAIKKASEKEPEYSTKDAEANLTDRRTKVQKIAASMFGLFGKLVSSKFSRMTKTLNIARQCADEVSKINAAILRMRNE